MWCLFVLEPALKAFFCPFSGSVAGVLWLCVLLGNAVSCIKAFSVSLDMVF